MTTVSSEERKPLPPEEAHIWAEDHNSTKGREQYSLPGCRVGTAQSSSIPTVSLTKGSMKAQVTSLLHFIPHLKKKGSVIRSHNTLLNGSLLQDIQRRVARKKEKKHASEIVLN